MSTATATQSARDRAVARARANAATITLARGPGRPGQGWGGAAAATHPGLGNGRWITSKGGKRVFIPDDAPSGRQIGQGRDAATHAVAHTPGPIEVEAEMAWFAENGAIALPTTGPKGVDRHLADAYERAAEKLGVEFGEWEVRPDGFAVADVRPKGQQQAAPAQPLPAAAAPTPQPKPTPSTAPPARKRYGSFEAMFGPRPGEKPSKPGADAPATGKPTAPAAKPERTLADVFAPRPGEKPVVRPAPAPTTTKRASGLEGVTLDEVPKPKRPGHEEIGWRTLADGRKAFIGATGDKRKPKDPPPAEPVPADAPPLKKGEIETPAEAPAARQDATEAPKPATDAPATPDAADATPAAKGGKAKRAPTALNQVRDQIKQYDAERGGGIPDEVRQELDGMRAPFVVYSGSPVASEFRQMLREGEGGKAIARSGAVRFTNDARAAGAEDARREMVERFGAKGEDFYWDAARERAGLGWRSSLDRTRQAAAAGDERAAFLVALHDEHAVGTTRGKKTQMVAADGLDLDHTATIGGEPIRVTEDADGQRIVEDGATFPTVPLDALAGLKLPIDRGSLRKVEPDVPADFDAPSDWTPEDDDEPVRGRRREVIPFSRWVRGDDGRRVFTLARGRGGMGQGSLFGGDGYWMRNKQTGRPVFVPGHTQGGLFDAPAAAVAPPAVTPGGLFAQPSVAAKAPEPAPRPEPRPEAVDKPTTTAEKPPESPAAKPAATPKPGRELGPALAAHDAFIRRRNDGDVTADQLREGYAAFNANEAAIKAELAGLKKDHLAKIVGGFYADRDTKPQLVERAFGRMREDFHLGESLSYGLTGPGSHKAALDAAIAKQTDADVAAFAERVARQRAERAERVAKVKSAVENPQTLEDFQTFVRVKKGGESELTPEQRERYDDLRSAKSKGERRAEAEKRATVTQAKLGETGMAYKEGWHTKRNEPVHTVQLTDRVDGDTFKDLAAKARQLGGNYSSWGKREDHGFQFRRKEDAERFMQLQKGDVDRADDVRQRREEVKGSASERMRAVADRMEAAARETMDADRKTNTARRADMAAGILARARADVATANTLRNVADALAEGKAKHLDGLRHRSHVETLNGILHRAKWERVTKTMADAPYAKREEALERPAGREDVQHAEYPYPKLRPSELRALAKPLAEIPGFKALGAKLLKNAKAGDPVFRSTVAGNKVHRAQLLRADAVPIPLPDGKVLRAHATSGWAISQAAEKQGISHRGPFWTVDGGKSWGVDHRSAIAAATRKGSKLDLVDPPADDPITISDPADVAAISDASRRLQKSDDWNVRRIGSQLFHGAESYERLRAMDIHTPEELRAALREYVPLKGRVDAEDPVKRMERNLIGKDIPGFFPTPRAAVDRMLDAADIRPGQKVLEPSAGKGDILDAIAERHPDAEAEGIEPVASLRDIVEAKGHKLAGRDVMEHAGEYDRVVMNPPFENGQDREHVRKAYDLLKPGGRLVAIMAGGSTWSSDQAKPKAFREWVDSVGGEVEDMPEGSFAGNDAFRQTGVRTRMVVIEKPARATLSRWTHRDGKRVFELARRPTPGQGHWITKNGKRVFIPGHAQPSAMRPGLFGQPVIDSSGIGRQQGMFHEPVEAKRPGGERLKASASAVDPANTAEMFPTEAKAATMPAVTPDKGADRTTPQSQSPQRSGGNTYIPRDEFGGIVHRATIEGRSTIHKQYSREKGEEVVTKHGWSVVSTDPNLNGKHETYERLRDHLRAHGFEVPDAPPRPLRRARFTSFGEKSEDHQQVDAIHHEAKRLSEERVAARDERKQRVIAAVREADEPWKMTKEVSESPVIYGDMQRATGWNAEDGPGPERTFYRLGEPPASGKSFNSRENKHEAGVSVYVTPTGGSILSDRPVYYGKGRQIGVGGDDEPVIEITGEWKKYPGHKKVVEQALVEGKPVPTAVLADYPALAKKYKKSPKRPAPAKSGGDARPSRERAELSRGMLRGRWVCKLAEHPARGPLPTPPTADRPSSRVPAARAGACATRATPAA